MGFWSESAVLVVKVRGLLAAAPSSEVSAAVRQNAPMKLVSDLPKRPCLYVQVTRDCKGDLQWMKC